MAKRLAIEVLAADELEGMAFLRVVEQTDRNSSFTADGEDTFTASNGMQLRSSSCPEWRKMDNALFVLGNDPRRDADILRISPKDVPEIAQAVREYNKAHADDEAELLPAEPRIASLIVLTIR